MFAVLQVQNEERYNLSTNDLGHGAGKNCPSTEPSTRV